MDFLNRAFGQLKDLFGSMTPGARITAGLLLTVIVVSLAYLYRAGVGGPDAFLLGGKAFSQSDLQQMVGAFAKAGLSDYTIEANRMRIPRGKNAAYVGALVDGNALPTDFGDYFSQATNGSSPFETRAKTEARLKHAKEKELQLFIAYMKGIEQAGVQYDVSKKRGLTGEKEITAAVVVKTVGDQKLDAQQVKGIKNLVSRAIAGLKPQQVAVMDANANIVYSSSSEDGVGSVEDNLYRSLKEQYEQDWQRKLSNAVAQFVEGAIVNVNVQLTKDLTREEITNRRDPKQIARKSVEESESTTDSNPVPAGRVGVEANRANKGTVVTTTLAKSTTEKPRGEFENVPVQVDRIHRKGPGPIPERVTATVGVPSGYYLKVWRERNPTPEGEKPKTPQESDLVRIEVEIKKKIENTVVKLLPAVKQGEDAFPLVEVTSFPQLSTAPLPEPTMQEDAVAWLSEHWSTLGMTLVGMFSLLMLRGMVRSMPQEAPPGGGEAGPRLSLVTGDEEEEEEEEEEEDEDHTHSQRKRRFSVSGPNLREELAGMVREDPDAAANILRNWIGE